MFHDGSIRCFQTNRIWAHVSFPRLKFEPRVPINHLFLDGALFDF